MSSIIDILEEIKMLEIKIKPLRSKLAERPGDKRASEGNNS